MPSGWLGILSPKRSLDDGSRTLRTAVRTKAAETVETRGSYWLLQAKTERTFAQTIAHVLHLDAAPGIACPSPGQNTDQKVEGSNPSGHLRARQIFSDVVPTHGPKTVRARQRGSTRDPTYDPIFVLWVHGVGDRYVNAALESLRSASPWASTRYRAGPCSVRFGTTGHKRRPTSVGLSLPLSLLHTGLSGALRPFSPWKISSNGGWRPITTGDHRPGIPPVPTSRRCPPTPLRSGGSRPFGPRSSEKRWPGGRSRAPEYRSCRAGFGFGFSDRLSGGPSPNRSSSAIRSVTCAGRPDRALECTCLSLMWPHSSLGAVSSDVLRRAQCTARRFGLWESDPVGISHDEKRR